MPDDVTTFYDGLAASYHFIFSDWQASVRRQGEALDTLIRARTGTPPGTLLDCTCGIGTQAIGLAERGYSVRGTDLSAEAVARAREYAAAMGQSIPFEAADLLNPDPADTATYDVVIACDNAVAHFLSDSDLVRALETMHRKLKPGGLLVVSQRDYDALVQEQPRTTHLTVGDPPDGRRIVFQVWDWAEDARRYDVSLFVLAQKGDNWETACHRTTLRALLRAETEAALKRAGFTNLYWHMPEQTGYHQPVVTAFKEESRE